MISMTGFGYAEGEENKGNMSVEIKSLNTRYLDIIPTLPSSLSVLESRIREEIQGRFSRGRIEVILRYRDLEEDLKIRVDTSAARAWKEALESLSTVLGTDESPTLEHVIRQDGVLKVERSRNPEALWPMAFRLLDQAAQDVLAHRQREGLALAADIEERLSEIEASLKVVEDRAPQVKAEVESTLRERFQEVLGDDAGEARILLETAAWIVKTDINEEIVRLRTHIGAFRDSSAFAGPHGKKLDFLAQEMGREINTIGSKSPQADVSHQVVAMKDALEKIREQLRNVE